MTFVLAVLLRPEVQRRAQEEIDSVTRRERFPTFEDRPKLPFVGALCKEILRWRPAAPLRAFPSVIPAMGHLPISVIHRYAPRFHGGLRV
jgi:cytochrome P450